MLRGTRLMPRGARRYLFTSPPSLLFLVAGPLVPRLCGHERHDGNDRRVQQHGIRQDRVHGVQA